MANRIECPLMGNIEDGICYDIHMVAEGVAPLRTAPKEATKQKGFEKICLECPNHRD